MDNKKQEIINIGERFIKMMQSSPNSPFDFSDKSIEYLQGVLATLKESKPDPKYELAVKIGSSLYLAKVLIKNKPDLKLEILLEGDKLLDIQVKNDKATLNLLSWVSKCIEDPEGDNITFKFKRASEQI